jgi:hypothetical protein
MKISFNKILGLQSGITQYIVKGRLITIIISLIGVIVLS